MITIDARETPPTDRPAAPGRSVVPGVVRWGMPLAAVVLAGTAVWTGATLPWIRDAEGFLTGRFALATAGAAAVLLAGFGVRARVAGAAAWLALGVLGQAAALQLMRAGSAVGYQHYVPLTELAATEHLPWLILVAAQAVAVAAGLARQWPRLRSWLAAQGGGRILGLAAVLILTSATLSRDPGVYAGELMLAAAIQLVALGTIALTALAVPAGTLDRLGARLDAVLGTAANDGRAEPGGPDRFALACAAWVVVACALLAWFSYERHPHVPDEVVYLYHARYFALGLPWMAPPPVPEAFNLDLMTYEPGRWYSPVPPGWPAVLALGTLLGAPWLVNPLLAGINVLLCYMLARELYDRRTARLGVLLLSASPWLLFMGMNFMTHTLTLTAALAAALCVARLRRTGRLGWAVPGGLAAGFLALLRPLEALIVAALLGAWTLVDARRRLRPAPVLVLALASLAGAAPVFPYNRMFTGSATSFPLIAYTDAQYGVGSNALGFGPERGLGWPGLDPFPGHGAVDVMVNTNLNLYQVNTELFGWATGSLLLLAFLVLSPRAWRRPDAALALVIAAVVAAHAFYWFSGGPDFGARYWFLILPPSVLLTVRGVQHLGASSARAATRALIAVLGLTFAAVTVFVPWRAADKYHHYRGMRPDVRRLAAAHDFGRSLVLVRGRRHPDYASAAAYNPVDLRAGAPVYAWDRGAGVRRAVLAAYADRPVWILDGPTITGAGYRVARGPVPARLLLSERSEPMSEPSRGGNDPDAEPRR